MSPWSAPRSPAPVVAKRNTPSKTRIAVGRSKRLYVGSGLIQPLDTIRRHLPDVFGRKIFGQSELRKDIFHRNALATALLKPSLTVVEAAAIFVGHWLIVGWSRGHGASDTIEQHEL